MLRKFIIGAAVGVAMLLLPRIPVTEAQIGYQGGFDGSTSLTVSADQTYADNIAIIWGSDGDLHMEYDSTLDALEIHDPADDAPWYLFNAGPTSPSTSAYYFQIAAGTVPTMTGAGHVTTLQEMSLTNADHSNGTLYGIRFNSFTGDAQADESAIAIEAGWDRALWVYDDMPIDFGTGKDFSLDYNSGSVQLILSDNVANFGFSIDLDGSPLVVIRDPDGSPTYTYSRVAAAASGSFVDLAGTLGVMDGSDTVSFLSLDIENANHTGSSNILNGILVEAITGDGQATETAINVGSGWDIDVGTDAGNNSLEIGVALVERVQINANNGTEVPMVGISVDLNASKPTGFGMKSGESVLGLNGSDTVALFNFAPFTDANHTGTGNLIALARGGAITSPDSEAIHTALLQESGWDLLALAHATNTAWQATDDPPSGYVGIYVQQGVNSSADCELVARLSDGTEVTIAQLVSLDVCP